MYGRSNHHKIEACFKAFARALRVACAKDKRLARNAAEHEGPAVIALVDYGAGNLTSVRKALAAIGAERRGRRASPASSAARTASSCPASATSTRPRASTADGATAIRPPVDDGMPLLGICVGLQWLFEGSAEAPDVPRASALQGQDASASRSPRPQTQDPETP